MTSNGEPQELPLLSISVIGHVDSGKSTLTGRLATRWGELDKRKMEKLEQIASSHNKTSFSLAYFSDTTKEERERGVTINTTIVKMRSSKFRLNLFDCPGHADYISNTTSGCKQADLSIVVVPADFTASCAPGGMLEPHIRLSKTLGVKCFIVCVNKLDEVAERNKTHVKSTFDSAVVSIMKKFKEARIKREDVIFLPISALNGIGIFKDGEVFDFYKDMAPTMLDENKKEVKILTLEDAINIQPAPRRALDAPLRMTISSIANVQGHGTIYCGKVDFGTLTKGMSVRFLPSNIVTKIKSIQEHKVDKESAPAGMNIGFSIELRDKAQQDKIKTGSIIASSTDTKFKMHSFYLVSAVSLKHGRETNGIRVGYTPLLSATTNVPCKFVKLISYETKKTGVVADPDYIPNNARFTAVIYPTKDCFLEKSEDFPSLSRFVCLDSSSLAAAGAVLECLTDEEAATKYGIDVVALKKNDMKRSAQRKRS